MAHLSDSRVVGWRGKQEITVHSQVKAIEHHATRYWLEHHAGPKSRVTNLLRPHKSPFTNLLAQISLLQGQLFLTTRATTRAIAQSAIF